MYLLYIKYYWSYNRHTFNPHWIFMISLISKTKSQMAHITTQVTWHFHANLPIGLPQNTNSQVLKWYLYTKTHLSKNLAVTHPCHTHVVL